MNFYKFLTFLFLILLAIYNTSFNQNLILAITNDFQANEGLNSNLDFHGIAYGAYRYLGPPVEYILRKNVIEDMSILHDLNVTNIRTYGLNYGQNVIPEEAKNVGIECATGIWLESNTSISNHMLNEFEIQTGLSLENVSSHLIVGNEVLLRGAMTPSLLIKYINKVKNQTTTPVTTAEPWNIWVDNPALVDACDVLFVHIYAYWEGQGASPIWDDQAALYTINRFEYLQLLYPEKEMYLAEVGWPSGPLTLGDPDRWSEAAQKAFYEDLLPLIQEKEIKTYLFSGFDEAWKEEGGVGPYWGVFREDRTPKPSAGVLANWFGGSVNWPRPKSNSPSDFHIETEEVANISWIITDRDNSTGSYLVYKNGSLLTLESNIWQNNTPIVINIDTSVIGYLNYTIVYSDGIKTGNDTVLVSIDPHPPDTTSSITTTNTQKSNYEILSFIFGMIVLSVYFSIRQRFKIR